MLTPEQLNHFKEMLENERQEILAKLDQLQTDAEETAADLETEGTYSTGGYQGDEASDINDLEQNLSYREFTDERLGQVEAALKRIEAGTYGFSEVSNQPIPIERLEVLPTATRLVSEEEDAGGVRTI